MGGGERLDAIEISRGRVLLSSVHKRRISSMLELNSASGKTRK